MPDFVIVDTSVLIALDKLNLLPLLCKIYSEIWITEAVKKEFGTIDLPCAVFKKTEGNLINLLVKDLNLGLGEAEVISLANDNKMKVMIDDMRARKIALNFGLQVTGTIGFLIKANKLNLIKSAYDNVLKLRKLGFYLSDQLLNEINFKQQKNK